MTSRIVAIPVFAAIWLALPAAASAQDQERRPSLAATARHEVRDAQQPRVAISRLREALSSEARQPVMAEQRHGGGDGGQRPSGGGPGGRSAGRPPSGGSAAGPRQPYRGRPPVVYGRPGPRDHVNVNIYSRPYYARPYYGRPIYSPGYYDRWARGVYGWSPLVYAPWAWIYGTAGYAGFGFSYGPYASYGGPYGAYGVYGGGYYGSYSPYVYYGHSSSVDTGGVRLKVRPRDAQVFVDGDYAGLVDNFDGSFESLKLAQGSHRVEIRMPGYESLEFDVHVQPDHTIVLQEDLRPRP